MNPDTLPVTIFKPIPGGACSIDYRILKEAVMNHQMIELTLTGYGTTLIDPVTWYKTAYKIETKKMKYQTPMKFVYNKVTLPGLYTRRKDTPLDQLSLFNK